MDPLFSDSLDPLCELIVVIPVCNEEKYIERCIAALAEQYDRVGNKLDPRCFEVHVLVNNTSDNTMLMLKKALRLYPDLRIRTTCLDFPSEDANVGTARRWLFEAAVQRFAAANRVGAIASTDADTVVSDRWIASIIKALLTAECIAGFIAVDSAEVLSLPNNVQDVIHSDRRYRMMLELLATQLDVNDPEPWPRHYHHTGASLALKTDTYERCGRMPHVTTHEDIALVRALRRIDARIMHRFDVAVSTSARCQARAQRGMGTRLAQWSATEGGLHNIYVRAPEEHVARTLARAQLRMAWLHMRFEPVEAVKAQSVQWRFSKEILDLLRAHLPFGETWDHYCALRAKRLHIAQRPIPLPIAEYRLRQILTSNCSQRGVRRWLPQVHG